MNNSVHSSNTNNKVLMIRMLGSADVCAIGLPAIRLFQKQNPDTELHFLTFGKAQYNQITALLQ